MTAKTLTKSDFAYRFALLEGTFAAGWAITRIFLGHTAAAETVKTFMRNGMMAEAVLIEWPSDLSPTLKDEQHIQGHHYLSLAECGVGNGLSIYGPFKDEESAEAAGEAFRPEDGEYSVTADPHLQNLAALLKRLPDDLVDAVVKEFSNELPLLQNPAVVVDLKELIRHQFTIKEYTQQSFDAVMRYIAQQLNSRMARTNIHVLLEKIKAGNIAVEPVPV